MNTIYFDQAARSIALPATQATYLASLRELTANQEAVHQAAYTAKKNVELAAAKISNALFGQPDYAVCFGNSGTELFNVLANYPELNQREILVTGFEHPALLAALARSGGQIITVKTNFGQIDLPDLQSKLGARTALLAFYHVQSELGLLLDYEPWRKLVRKQAPQAVVFADIVQSAGKLPVPEADWYLLAGHKFGAVGGAALVASNRNRTLVKFLHSCRSPRYLVSRVEPELIVNLADTLALRRQTQEQNAQKVLTLHRFLATQISQMSGKFGCPLLITLPELQQSPYILHVILPKYQSAVIVRMLSQYGIYCSSASACQAESDKPSAVLPLLNLGQYGYNGLRLSFAPENTLDEAKFFCEILQKILLDY